MTEQTPSVAKRMFRPIEPTVTVFTFGAMYTAEEPHPSGLPAFGKGWWEVQGVSRDQARSIVFALTEGQYAFDYESGAITESHYPLGCTFRISAAEPFPSAAWIAARRAEVEVEESGAR